TRRPYSICLLRASFMKNRGKLHTQSKYSGCLLIIAALCAGEVLAFDNTSFQSPVNFIAGSGQVGLAIADLDGDGKPDAVVANYSSGTISVYRNIGTTGVVNSASFAPKVDFAVGNTPVFVKLIDIDGDGRLDIAVVNEDGASISVLRNTSTVGTINSNSFAA